MKKIILTVAAIAGGALSGFSQGQVDFENANANGYVVTSLFGDTSSTVTSSYQLASSFSVQLWSLAVSSTAGLTGLDAYGYLQGADLASDGFTQDSNIGTVAGTDGGFGPVTAQVNGVVSANAALAVVAWTGNFSSLAAAMAGGGQYGILVFEQAIGPAQPSPFTQDIAAGWNTLANSPGSAANGGNDDLILTAVPEPTTMALAGLGGLSLFFLRRKK
jgi:hypothetical protein